MEQSVLIRSDLFRYKENYYEKINYICAKSVYVGRVIWTNSETGPHAKIWMNVDMAKFVLNCPNVIISLAALHASVKLVTI